MYSKDFQDFVSSCFPRSWGADREGLNYDALLRLTGDELLEAEKLILENIDKPGKAIESAGYLKLKSAIPLLKDYLEDVLQEEKLLSRAIEIAWALYQIEKYPRSLTIIIEALEKEKIKVDNTWNAIRWTAFYYFPWFGEDEKAIGYLKELVNDPRFSFDAQFTLECIKQKIFYYPSSSEILTQISNRINYDLVNKKY